MIFELNIRCIEPLPVHNVDCSYFQLFENVYTNWYLRLHLCHQVTDADGDEDMYLTYEVTKGNEEGQFDFINGYGPFHFM